MSDADAGGTDPEEGSTGVNARSKLRILRGCGLGCCAGERRKPGRASSDARVPRHGVTHFDPRGGPRKPGLGWPGRADLGLVPKWRALCLLQPAECAARPAGAQPPSPPSSLPRPPRGRQGPGARGRRPAPARGGPQLCGNPAGAAATAAGREEGGGAHRPGRSLLARNQARHRASQLV